MQSLRYPLSMTLALGLAGAIFWALWTMVHVKADIGEIVIPVRIEFTPLIKDTPAASTREVKPDLQPPLVAPRVPLISIDEGWIDSHIAKVTPLVDSTAPQIAQFDGSGSDRDVMPLVRINPDYPQRALSRGIEGWVVVRFIITAAGTVRDATVVDSEPKGVFDDAAIKAVLRWRYNPKVERGQAVERVGVQTMLRFGIDEQ